MLSSTLSSKILTCILKVAMFTSGLVLLLNIWGGKQLGVTFELSKQLEAVHNCINVLRMFEHRWVLSVLVYK